MWHMLLWLSDAIDFQLDTDFLFQCCVFYFAFFTAKSPVVTQRSVSQENAFKKEQKPVKL